MCKMWKKCLCVSLIVMVCVCSSAFAALGAAGDIYVASNAGPMTITQVKVSGGVEGVFASPSSTSYGLGLAWSPYNGNLYVAGGNYANVMQVNGTTGAVIGEFAGGLGRTADLAFGPNNSLYVTSNNYNNVSIVPLGGGTTSYLGIMSPTGIVFDSSSNMYVSSQNDNRIWKFTYDSGTASYSAGFAWSQVSELMSAPEGLTIGPNGNIFVASRALHRVLEFSSIDGSYIREAVPYAGGTMLPDVPGEDLLWHPTDMLFRDNGNILVSYMGNGVIYEFNGTTGTRVGTFASGIDRPAMMTIKPIPEPATICLMGLGLVAALKRRMK